MLLFFKKLKRRWRRVIWKTPAEEVSFDGGLGNLCSARPVDASGFDLVVGSGQSRRTVTYQAAIDKVAFLRSWYALGGGTVEDEDGCPWDPDS